MVFGEPATSHQKSGVDFTAFCSEFAHRQISRYIRFLVLLLDFSYVRGGRVYAEVLRVHTKTVGFRMYADRVLF